MAFGGLTLLLTWLSYMLSVEVAGQYQMPIPYQQVYQQPYPQFNPYQQPYQGYSQFRPYVYPQTGLQLPYYPYGGYQQGTSQMPVGRLPEGYRIEPLSPAEMQFDENAIISGMPFQNQGPSILPVQPMIQSGTSYVPRIQRPPDQPGQAQPHTPTYSPIQNQPQTLEIPLRLPEKPRYTVEIVTSKPAEYTVHEDSWSTKYTNNNNSFVYRKVEHKPFNSTIRRVFTTDGAQSGNKVYTINIVNGMEVTTTEDPNAIITSDNQGTAEETDANNVADDLEENNADEEQDKEESENKPGAILSWFS